MKFKIFFIYYAIYLKYYAGIQRTHINIEIESWASWSSRSLYILLTSCVVKASIFVCIPSLRCCETKNHLNNTINNNVGVHLQPYKVQILASSFN